MYGERDIVMKQRRQIHKPYGLQAKFALSLGASAILCVVVFCGIYFSMDFLFSDYFERSDFQERHNSRQIESLQKYINDNQISSKDISKIEKWERRQPIILLEVYDGNSCIYSSFDEVISDWRQQGIYDDIKMNSENTISMKLEDGKVQIMLYSDFTYQYYVFEMVFSIISALVLFLFLFLRSTQRLIRYICRLNEEVQILEGGNLGYQVSVEGNDEITELAISMNRMRESFQKQIEKEQQLYQTNRKLVTEMSHDLRTPLTSILLYLEILRTHRYTSDKQLQDYLEKIDAKAHHIKQLSDYLFEYSQSGIREKIIEPVGVEQAFQKSLSALQEELRIRGFHVTMNLSWGYYFVQVKPEYVQRIFENIISNIIKYADPSESIQINTIDEERYYGLSILNVCLRDIENLNSSGIGMESIKTMMKQMNGMCTVEQTDVAFETTLLFLKQ